MCSTQLGYCFPEGASRLREVAKGIQLPTILAQYVESVGKVQLASGVTCVPFVADYQELFPEGYPLQLDPNFFLEQPFAPRPRGFPLGVEEILMYNNATTRGARSGMKFRCIDNSDLTGRNEMLVSYTDIGDQSIPKCPQVITESEAQLGVCYRFRDYTTLDQWLGGNKELLFDAFTAIPVEPQVVFTDICVAAMKATGKDQNE